MKIEFTTKEYEWENGHSPRGYGHWGFEFEGCEFWALGTLTEAKAQCRKYIRENAPANCSDYLDTVTVNVMP